jgi:hypothetical protein
LCTLLYIAATHLILDVIAVSKAYDVEIRQGIRDCRPVGLSICPYREHYLLGLDFRRCNIKFMQLLSRLKTHNVTRPNF